MKKALTVLFFLVFIFLFTLVLILGELKFYVFTPAFVKDPMKENKIYHKLTSNPDMMMEQITKQGPGKPLEQMPSDARELSGVVLKSVDEKWFETEFEKTVGAFFDYVMSDQKALKINVDLRNFKIKLRKNLDEWIHKKYNSLPEVTVEEFERQVSEGKEKFPMVRPQGLALEQTVARVGFDPVGEIMSKIPDKLDTSYVDQNKSGAMNGLSGFKKLKPVFDWIGIIFYVLASMTIVLLLLAAKITSKSRVEFLMRLGLYLCAAFVPFALFIVLRYVTVNILIVELISRAGLPAFFRNEIVTPILTSAVNRTFLHLLLVSGVLSTCGSALLIPTRYSAFKATSATTTNNG